MNQEGGRRSIISDYVFPDETDTDISERIKQLFDYDIDDAKNDIVYVEDLPRKKFFILVKSCRLKKITMHFL